MYKDTILLDFGGGLESLVTGENSPRIEVPHSELAEYSQDCRGSDLVHYLVDKRLGDKAKKALLDDNGSSLKPGILVLVNEADVELKGGLEETKIEPGDSVSFISTLHGG